jgi:hypothetical protein
MQESGMVKLVVKKESKVNTKEVMPECCDYFFLWNNMECEKKMKVIVHGNQ